MSLNSPEYSQREALSLSEQGGTQVSGARYSIWGDPKTALACFNRLVPYTVNT